MPDLREKDPAGLNLLTATELSGKLEQKQTTSVAIVEELGPFRVGPDRPRALAKP